MSAKAPVLSISRTAPCDPLSASMADGAGPCWTCQLVHAVVVRAMSAVTLRRMGLRAADHAKLAHATFRCQRPTVILSEAKDLVPLREERSARLTRATPDRSEERRVGKEC